jgi:hypothetical protein
MNSDASTFVLLLQIVCWTAFATAPCPDACVFVCLCVCVYAVKTRVE